MIVLRGPYMFRLLIKIVSVCMVFDDMILRAAKASAIRTNKMRYASSKGKLSESLPLEQVFEMAASTARLNVGQESLRPRPLGGSSLAAMSSNINGKLSAGKLLDEEDKRLLEKFYRETINNGHTLGDSQPTETLWDDQGLRNALLDDEHSNFPGNKQIVKQYGSKQQNVVKNKHQNPVEGWTVDPEIVFQDNQLLYQNNDYGIDKNIVPTATASYSPTLRLLTSYNPIVGRLELTNVDNNKIDVNNLAEEKVSSNADNTNHLIGTTLYGNDRNVKPSISSKSAVQAVKLHDELMRKPPTDGKVRVRMYYHRAIHDDSKLYGTGPWKYWGHGWGMEFGYDPKSQASDKDFYQKGYTIERAFGRDFCLDKNNCRKPDPDFFKDPQNVGKYSTQYHQKYMNSHKELGDDITLPHFEASKKKPNIQYENFIDG